MPIGAWREGTTEIMKRTLAAVALLSALGVLCKLAWKGAPVEPTPPPPVDIVAPAPSPAALLLDRYPEDRALVERVVRDYHHNAIAIEKTDGLRGLMLLDRLGLEAVFLYEKYPRDFRRLRDALSDTAAADVLLHWREYFALKRAEELDRGILIAEITQLSPAARRAAAQYPHALPLVLAEPVGMTEIIERFRYDPEDLRDVLVTLDFINLEAGAADLRAALRVFDLHGPLALEAFRLQGPDGLALVKLYGTVLEALGDALPLNDALVLLRVNTDDLDAMLANHPPETVAGHLRHVAATNLVAQVGGSPHGLQLTVDFGDLGDRALRQAGPDAADVVYDEYADPVLRRQAVAALAEHGPMALAILAKYASDAPFREVLRRHGPEIIPPIAQADPAPEVLAALRAKEDKTWTEALAQGVLALSRENGQATIRLIQNDGLDRVQAMNSTNVEFYQFLPLYDVVHLVHVLGSGYAPTGGELTWALIDGCFAVADVLSLTAVQPEGAAAVEVARSEIKAAVQQATRSTGREIIEQAAESGGRVAAREGAEASARRLARWWAVRSAGGTYSLLRRLPEAIGKLGLPEIAQLGRPLCAKAGLRLSQWAPVRFLLHGQAVFKAIPPGYGLRLARNQVLVAGVGVVAMQKMEEHLRSRRPDGP